MRALSVGSCSFCHSQSFTAVTIISMDVFIVYRLGLLFVFFSVHVNLTSITQTHNIKMRIKFVTRISFKCDAVDGGIVLVNTSFSISRNNKAFEKSFAFLLT